MDSAIVRDEFEFVLTAPMGNVKLVCGLG